MGPFIQKYSLSQIRDLSTSQRTSWMNSIVALSGNEAGALLQPTWGLRGTHGDKVFFVGLQGS